MSIFREQPDLLEAFRRGERHALERVYRTYVRELDAYLRTLARAATCPELAQPSAIADALQEVFVRAFSPTARNSFQAGRPFSPYLRAIARNFFIDLLRSRAHEVAKADERSFESVVPSSEGEIALEPRVSALLSTYVASLSEPLKGVYEQRFVLGHSQEDACAALGLSRRKLRTAEARLKAGLRKALAHAGVPPAELESERRPSRRAPRPPAFGGPHVVR
jgi:RNA polymerase sigma factor (sigma-70 family)